MTIQNDDRKTTPVVTDGETGIFYYDFPIFFGEDGQKGLEVRYENELNYDVVSPTEYIVLPNTENTGGYVQFAQVPVAGKNLIIVGKTQVDQQLNITNHGKFQAEAIETNFDKIVSIMQEWSFRLSEEERQRIANDSAIVQQYITAHNELKAYLEYRFDMRWQEMSDYLDSLLPMFFCIMRKELNAFVYSDEGIQNIVDQISIDNGFNAGLIVDGNQTQKEINLYGGKTYDMPVGGYPVGGLVRLDNGDIVKSTIPNNTNNPNVDITGWVGTGNVVEVKSVSRLLSIQNLANGSLAHLDGQQGGLFKYDSNRSLENDGGTIFNGWARIDFDHINFDMFGADSTGVVDAQSKIKAAYEASFLLKKPVLNNSGVYLLNSSSIIYIKYFSNTAGSIFKLGANFSGAIRAGNDVDINSSTSGSLLEGIKSLGLVTKGSKYISGINNYIIDKYVRLHTTLPTHFYRGELQTHVEFNKVLNNNCLESEFLFSVDLNTVDRVYTQDVSKTGLTVSGITIDETLLNNSIGQKTLLVLENTNNAKIIDYRVISGGVVNFLRNRVSVLNTFDCEINNVCVPSDPEDSANNSSYTLYYGYCYNLVIDKLNSLGRGWASTGANLSRRITYKNSKVKRIDHHTIFQELLKIKDCVVGARGISVCGVGDIQLIDSEVQSDEAKSVGISGASFIVTNRPDAGGFIDGNLIINNLRLTGKINPDTNHYYSLVFSQNVGLVNGAKPLGSLINYRMFNTININGVYCNIYGIDTLNLLKSYQAKTDLVIEPPSSVIISNIQTNVNIVAFEVNKFKQVSYDVNLKINNINCNSFYLFTDYDYGVNNKVNAKIASIYSSINGYSVIQSYVDGHLTISDCKISRYIELGANKPKLRILNSDYSLTTVNAGFVEGAINSKGRVLLRNITATSSGNGIYANTYKNQLCNINASSVIIDGFSSALSRTFLASSTVVNTANFDVPAYGFLKLRIKYGTVIKVFDIAVNEANTFEYGSVAISGNTATVTINATNLKEVWILESY